MIRARRTPLGPMKGALCAFGFAVAVVGDAHAQGSGPSRALEVTPQQASAVERGLVWLANHQETDGSWNGKIGYKLNDDYNYTAERGHVGVTSLAGMAFLAGGHLPGRGRHGKSVERCLDFVLSCVQEDGYITHAGTRMYSHAFATLFLAEIYGMTHRDDVRHKLQKSVDFVVKSQNAEGGWRYEPYAVESDMSIVVCSVLALRAARNIGIRVPVSTVDSAARYVVDSAVTEASTSAFSHPAFARSSELGSFHYQKDVHSRSSFPLTAAGVTALHGLGIYSDEAIERGIHYLNRELTTFNHRNGNGRRSRGEGHYFFWYGHYYGVQAMYTVGSPYWEPYFEEVRELLLGMQHADGSWPNETGPGPAFGTAMGVLILEIPYRFLPIFQR
ncbi:MAG: prenyltransferase/squalene oxidase repeat-containing protein [Planctomycetota bacterium]|nr:prenyltransferase/squalene oxidase repeat-containing protein [Planctomycetota bacterium]